TSSAVRLAMASTDKACKSATRKRVRCGDPARGTTARAPRASTRSPVSSGTRCHTSNPGVSPTKTRSTSPRTSRRSRDRSTRSRTRITSAGKFQSTRCTTAESEVSDKRQTPKQGDLRLVGERVYPSVALDVFEPQRWKPRDCGLDARPLGRIVVVGVNDDVRHADFRERLQAFLVRERRQFPIQTFMQRRTIA